MRDDFRHAFFVFNMGSAVKDKLSLREGAKHRHGNPLIIWNSPQGWGDCHTGVRAGSQRHRMI